MEPVTTKKGFQLPAELVEAIVQNLDPSDLKAASLVSRTGYLVASPLLYQCLSVRLQHSQASTCDTKAADGTCHQPGIIWTLERFEAFLCKSPYLAHRAEGLTVSLHAGQSPLILDATSAQKLLHILHALPRLKRISLIDVMISAIPGSVLYAAGGPRNMDAVHISLPSCPSLSKDFELADRVVTSLYMFGAVGKVHISRLPRRTDPCGFSISPDTRPPEHLRIAGLCADSAYISIGMMNWFVRLPGVEVPNTLELDGVEAGVNALPSFILSVNLCSQRLEHLTFSLGSSFNMRMADYLAESLRVLGLASIPHLKTLNIAFSLDHPDLPRDEDTISNSSMWKCLERTLAPKVDACYPSLQHITLSTKLDVYDEPTITALAKGFKEIDEILASIRDRTQMLKSIQLVLEGNRKHVSIEQMLPRCDRDWEARRNELALDG